MRLLDHVIWIAIVVVAAACTDLTAPPQLSPPATDVLGTTTGECDPLTAVTECADEDEGANRESWPFFAPHGDFIYEAPGDPSPGSPGIWLAATIAPEACFNDRNVAIVDRDRDWLDDTCELELARGFAPTWGMGEQDECPGGEPVWAAKYFPTYNVVRIAYLPAYYDDCGVYGGEFLGIGGGHTGDSEFVIVEIGYNAATKHWEFRRMFLSAHYGEQRLSVSFDRSAWVSATEARFKRRHLGHPYVAVAANKHANYKSEETCNKTFASQVGYSDWCYGNILTPFRFPVDPSRNAGSRFTDLFEGCIHANNARFDTGGRTECFYAARRAFNGWHLTGAMSARPYYDVLMDNFENRDGDMGPGPHPYVPRPPGEDPLPPPDPGCSDPTQVVCTN